MNKAAASKDYSQGEGRPALERARLAVAGSLPGVGAPPGTDDVSELWLGEAAGVGMAPWCCQTGKAVSDRQMQEAAVHSEGPSVIMRIHLHAYPLQAKGISFSPPRCQRR